MEFKKLMQDIKSCRLCESHLAHGVRPILQINPSARLLIVGQAPGRKVHESGVPFDDASGQRLREWLGISKKDFYNSRKVSILPMGFCYPGTGKSGDLPPRPECEIAWRQQLMAHLSNVKLTIVLGRFAQIYHFGNPGHTLTELVKSWEQWWPEKIPLPHPSPRNNIWLKKNPWFEIEVLPTLKTRVANILQH